MNPENHSSAPPPQRVWPRLVLAGAILFFAVSVIWMLVFIERVKRIRESTYPDTNAIPTTNQTQR